MSGLLKAAVGVAASLFIAQTAMSTTVNFNPSTTTSGHWELFDDPTTAQDATLKVTIQGAGFTAASLGTWYMNEEAPFVGQFGSDTITISNDAASGFGVLDFFSGDFPFNAQNPTCNGWANEGVAPGQSDHCKLTLFLNNGQHLKLDFFSPAGDLPGTNLSDTVDLAVPEPGSLALVGLALLASTLARRARKTA